jgi:hypothetical protein
VRCVFGGAAHVTAVPVRAPPHDICIHVSNDPSFFHNKCVTKAQGLWHALHEL